MKNEIKPAKRSPPPTHTHFIHIHHIYINYTTITLKGRDNAAQNGVPLGHHYLDLLKRLINITGNVHTVIQTVDWAWRSPHCENTQILREAITYSNYLNPVESTTNTTSKNIIPCLICYSTF